MRLYLYVFDADAEPSLLEEVTDLEEAVTACQELVAVDGYPRAEVWSGQGDRLYGLVREGSSLRTLAACVDPDESDEDEADRGDEPDGDDEQDEVEDARAAIRIETADARHAGNGTHAGNGSGGHGASRLGRADGSAASDTDEVEQPDAAPPQQLLGERPGRSELWFGM